jgi:hypothetical protein
MYVTPTVHMWIKILKSVQVEPENLLDLIPEKLPVLKSFDLREENDGFTYYVQYHGHKFLLKDIDVTIEGA